MSREIITKEITDQIYKITDLMKVAERANMMGDGYKMQKALVDAEYLLSKTNVKIGDIIDDLRKGNILK